MRVSIVALIVIVNGILCWFCWQELVLFENDVAPKIVISYVAPPKNESVELSSSKQVQLNEEQSQVIAKKSVFVDEKEHGSAASSCEYHFYKVSTLKRKVTDLSTSQFTALMTAKKTEERFGDSVAEMMKNTISNNHLDHLIPHMTDIIFSPTPILFCDYDSFHTSLLYDYLPLLLTPNIRKMIIEQSNEQKPFKGQKICGTEKEQAKTSLECLKFYSDGEHFFIEIYVKSIENGKLPAPSLIQQCPERYKIPNFYNVLWNIYGIFPAFIKYCSVLLSGKADSNVYRDALLNSVKYFSEDLLIALLVTFYKPLITYTILGYFVLPYGQLMFWLVFIFWSIHEIHPLVKWESVQEYISVGFLIFLNIMLNGGH